MSLLAAYHRLPYMLCWLRSVQHSVTQREAGMPAGGFWAPYATFVSISIGYAIVAGSLVAFVEPLAAGSGIPEIKTYLNGIHIKGLLTVSYSQATVPFGHMTTPYLEKCVLPT